MLNLIYSLRFQQNERRQRRLVDVTYLRTRMLNDVTTKFFVDEKKRTVVCVMTARNDVPARLMKYGLSHICYFDTHDCVYKGIAKCAPDDEWDEAYGRHLAEYRAARARQLDVNRQLNSYIKKYSRCLNNLKNYGLLKDPHWPERDNFHQMTLDEV